MQNDLAKVNTKDGTLTTEVCQLKDDSATIAADMKLVQDNVGKLAAAITTLRSQQVIDQQNKPPAPPLRKRDESTKTRAELVGKGKKKATASEQEASYDAAFEDPTEERMRACIDIFQKGACIPVYLCQCGGEYDFQIATATGVSGSAGKAYGRGRGCSCFKELISERKLADMYSALSGGKLAIATKNIGDKRRDPPIPAEWANAMFDLVSADDCTGKPIFHPTQEFIDQPSHQKKTLSFSPARGKKREAERTKLDFQPATKKEKQKKEKKEKKQKKQKNHDKSKSKHKKSKKVRT